MLRCAWSLCTRCSLFPKIANFSISLLHSSFLVEIVIWAKYKPIITIYCGQSYSINFEMAYIFTYCTVYHCWKHVCLSVCMYVCNEWGIFCCHSLTLGNTFQFWLQEFFTNHRRRKYTWEVLLLVMDFLTHLWYIHCRGYILITLILLISSTVLILYFLMQL